MHTIYIYLCLCVCVGGALRSDSGSWPFLWAPRSHSLDTPHSVGLLWTSDQHDAYSSTSQYTTFKIEKHPCPQTGFEPAIPTSERPQTHALDCAATGTGI